jgi:hypothetical protein
MLLGRATIHPSRNVQGFTAAIVPMQDASPDLPGRFRKPEQFSIFLIDNAFIDQEIQIDRTAPVAFAHQDNWDRLDLPRLNEREHLE